jgi:hypothetical protein
LALPPQPRQRCPRRWASPLSRGEPRRARAPRRRLRVFSCGSPSPCPAAEHRSATVPRQGRMALFIGGRACQTHGCVRPRAILIALKLITRRVMDPVGAAVPVEAGSATRRAAAIAARHPPSAHASLPAADERQGRALHPHPARRLGLAPSTAQAPSARPPLTAGSGTTTIDADTQPSALQPSTPTLSPRPPAARHQDQRARVLHLGRFAIVPAAPLRPPADEGVLERG